MRVVVEAEFGAQIIKYCSAIEQNHERTAILVYDLPRSKTFFFFGCGDRLRGNADSLVVFEMEKSWPSHFHCRGPGSAIVVKSHLQPELQASAAADLHGGC